MRIAHVTATFPPYYGGTGNVCYHNARVLAKRGHDVHVFTAAWPGEPDDPEGVTVHRWSPIFRLGNAPLMPRLALLRGFDLIHLHCPFIAGAEYVALGAAAGRTPLVVTYHNDLIAPGIRGRLFHYYDWLVTRRVLPRVRRICAVSMDHARSSTVLGELARRRPALFTHMPNGVDTAAFCPQVSGAETRRQFGLSEECVVFAFVAALDSAHTFKRLDLLLRAMGSHLADEAHLLVVGGGDLEAEYRQLSTQLGLASRVHFVGAVQHSRLPPILAAADVLVLPSDSVESFGLVLIEAMAVGRPVIATNIPGVRELVRSDRDGLLIEPGSSAALGQAMAAFCRMSSDRRGSMGEAGRRKVEQCYDWNRIGDRLERVYGDVLAEKCLRRAS